MAGPTNQGGGQQSGGLAQLHTVIELAASIAGLAGYIYLIGGVITWVRLVAAQLPADPLAAIVDPRVLFAVGFKAIVFVAFVLGVLCLVAYAAAGINWTQRRNAWHALFMHGAADAITLDNERSLNPADDPNQLISETQALRPELRAPLGEPAVRVVAGLNLIVLSGIVGLCVARIVELLPGDFSRPVVPAFLIVTALTAFLLLRWGPLGGGRIRRVVVTVLFLVVALFSTAPIGIVVLASVAIAWLGGVITQVKTSKSVVGFLHSPLPWLMLTVYALAAFAYVAQPPVLFSRAVVTTASGAQTGGYLARTSDGVYLVTCRGLADVTSRRTRTVLIPASTITSTSLGGASYRVDSGTHPSLAKLAVNALGLSGTHVPTWFEVDFRDERPTCGGLLPMQTDEKVLGPGVYTGRAPASGRASDGEPPIEQTGPRQLAQLAKAFQPTVETTVADRFWPVSVGAVLNEASASGFLSNDAKTTCLMKNDRCAVRHPTLNDLDPAGASTKDSLNYPESLDSDPGDQFDAFERGQRIMTRPIGDLLDAPRHINPWKSAQVYFLDGGIGHYGSYYGHIPANLHALEYWFFYPYNYYPLAVSRSLMASSPIGGDQANGDLHEGDWEHATVLLDPNTMKPKFLYLARHDGEGQALPWNSSLLHFDHGHPIVQAAYGGHPTYPNTCGQFPRPKTYDELSDWVVCGSGRYAFRAATTPLVDLAATSWGCWPGHFGEATGSELRNLKREHSDLRYLAAKNYTVAGPISPLRQAENTGFCKKR